MRTLILLLAVPLIGASCSGDPAGTPTEPASDLRDDTILGTVAFVDVEGGCWKIRPDDGGPSYEPLNLPPEYRKDGLRVSFVVSPADELLGSICQVGILVNLESIEAVDR